MPAYAYEALDAQGATQKGLIDADTAKAARSLLRARALVPMLVEPAMNAEGGGGSGMNITLWGGNVFNATTLAVWTR
ncbi:MAG: type II secretion system protein GspF, partial [Hydrogenophaga sp.]